MVHRLLCAVLLMLALALPATAQTEAAPVEGPADGEITTTGQAVDVTPVARDDQIETRIAGILAATGWYRQISVKVDDGIVFLDGETANETRQLWARDLAAKTSGVVAVVNRIRVDTALDFSFAPALAAMEDLGVRLLRAIPSILLAIVVLPLAWFVASVVRRVADWSLRHRMQSSFLSDLVSHIIALPVLLLGIYVVLQAAGLTQLALSLVGGAGVIGIVIGFAFRDIAENFLASLLLSIRQPFRRGDFISVAGEQGLVHSMNTRSTVLVSPEGNHIQIPNAMVFKSIIENLTAVPSRREKIELSIGHKAAISDAQSVILRVLHGTEGVIATPEPMVLASELAPASVKIMVFYWFDGQKVSPLKLRSLLIQRIKQALADAGIPMPGALQEIVFPEGIPGVGGAPEAAQPGPARQVSEAPREDTETPGARNLANEKDLLGEQLQAPVEGDKDHDLLAS